MSNATITFLILAASGVAILLWATRVLELEQSLGGMNIFLSRPEL